MRRVRPSHSTISPLFSWLHRSSPFSSFRRICRQEEGAAFGLFASNQTCAIESARRQHARRSPPPRWRRRCCGPSTVHAVLHLVRRPKDACATKTEPRAPPTPYRFHHRILDSGLGVGQFIPGQAAVHDVRREIRPVPHWLKGWRPWHSYGCHPPTPQRDDHPHRSEVGVFS